MKTLVHHSPLGVLWIPDVGEVEAGVPFDVPDDIAPGLLIQEGLYEPAGKAKRT